jgi:hypothetical protein
MMTLLDDVGDFSYAATDIIIFAPREEHHAWDGRRGWGSHFSRAGWQRQRQRNIIMNNECESE